MAETNGEDIVVEIAPEAPVEATPAPAAAEATPAPAAPTPVSDDPQVGVDDLKRQLADERARADRETAARLEAERRAQNANGEVQLALTAKQQAEYDSIVNALGAAEREADQLKAEATAALEAGEFAKANDIQLKLGRIGARIERLEEGKQAYDARRPVGGKAPPAQPARVAPDWNKAWNGEETEVFLATRTPRTAAWIRQHNQFASDPTFRNKVAGADAYVAQTLGIPRDSDDYFAKLEEIVGLRTPTERKDPVSSAAPPPTPAPTPTPAPAAAPRAPTPAAPPTPSVPSSRPGANSRVVTLTPEEAAHARATLTKDIIGDKDPLVVFAKHKAEAIAKGEWFGINGQR